MDLPHKNGHTPIPLIKRYRQESIKIGSVEMILHLHRADFVKWYIKNLILQVLWQKETRHPLYTDCIKIGVRL